MLIKNLFYFLSLMLLLGGQNAFAQLSLTVTPTAETCPNNGTLDFAVTGAGAGTITYKIWKRANLEATATITQSNNLGGLHSGFYIVKAEETIGANIVASDQDTVQIMDNQIPLLYNFETTIGFCDTTSSIEVEVTQGTASSYSIISGPVTRPAQASPIFTQLPSGVYLVNVADALCPGAASSKGVTLSPPNKSSYFSSRFHQRTAATGLSCNSNDSFALEFSPYFSLMGDRTFVDVYWIYTLPGNTAADTIHERVDSSIARNTVFNPNFPYNGTPYNITQLLVDTCGVFSERLFENRGRTLGIRIFATSFSSNCSGIDHYINLDVTGYVNYYLVEFNSFPAGFDTAGIHRPSVDTARGVRIQYGSSSNPVPAGNYIFTVTDSCGLSDTFHRVVSPSQGGGAPPLALDDRSRPAFCGDTVIGILSIMFRPSIVLPSITAISPASARTEFVSMYGPLPYNVSRFMNGSSDLLTMLAPFGSYTIRANETYCNTTISIPATFTSPLTNGTVTVNRNCTNYLLTSTYSGTKYIQKYEEVSDSWVHPITGVPSNPDGSNIVESSYPFPNWNTPVDFEGTFRVITLVAGLEGTVDSLNLNNMPTTNCIQVLDTFSYIRNPEFEAYSYACTNGKLTINIDVQGQNPPFTYKILVKNGVADTVDNGTNPVFPDLELGSYTVQVIDACLNSTIRDIDVGQLNMPEIVPFNLCPDSDSAALSVHKVSGFAYYWFKNGNTQDTLSTSSVLAFTPFDIVANSGNYTLEIVDTTQWNCNNFTLAYTIDNTIDLPNPGEGVSESVCDVANRGIIDLFDYLVGDYDDYGTWKEISEVNSGELTGNLWNIEDADSGVYIFEYTVPGSECFEPASTLVVFQIDIDCTPLNVDFTNFNVRKMGTSGHLNWKVASEKSTKGYYVEKSLDGQQWATLNFVPSQAPNGVSSNSLDYQFVDKTLQKGYNFYRIKHMDWEGKHKYSPIKYLEVGTINTIVIHPNPAVDAINIKGLSEGNLLMIHNIVGKKIHESTANAASVQINTQQFQPGIYVLTVIDAQGISSTHKIVIKD